MKFDHTTICKPVILRELLFYKSLNEDLKQFTPKYHGRRANIWLLLSIVTLHVVECYILVPCIYYCTVSCSNLVGFLMYNMPLEAC